jgi:hypothetical protein
MHAIGGIPGYMCCTPFARPVLCFSEEARFLVENHPEGDTLEPVMNAEEWYEVFHSM